MGNVVSRIQVLAIIPAEPPLAYLVGWVKSRQKSAPEMAQILLLNLTVLMSRSSGNLVGNSALASRPGGSGENRRIRQPEFITP